ncbi:MAG: SRPBCC domain-containing protein [Thiohalomonadales bacterium]
MSELTVNIQKTLKAPIEKVFDAWLDAKTLSKFMLPMSGMPEPRTESEGKQGGSFSIFMVVDGNEMPHTGNYLEVNRYSKLVFTWQSPFSADDSVVTILFSSANNGGTKVEFTHVKFIDEEARDNHAGGWAAILDALENVLSTAAETKTATV